MTDTRTDWITDRGGIAHVLGVSTHHVHKLVARGMPRAARGRYDVAECVQWYLRQLESGGAIDPDELPEVVQERTRLYAAQRRHKELETKRLEGRVIDIEEHEAALQELAAVLVSGVESWPVRAAPAMVRASDLAEAIDGLQREAHATRDQIAERAAALAAHLLATDGAPTPAAEP